MKILLVDDSKSARYALRLALQRLDVEVDTAESAEAAIEMLQGELPDAILMDHMMPGLNGVQALEIIHANPRTAHLPIVICTSHEDPDFAADALRRGATAVLPKSAAAEQLPDILSGLRRDSDQQPSAAAPADALPPAAATAVTVTAQTAPGWSQDPELMRLIEERIDARLNSLIAPLLQDLERNLSERLLATTQQLIESRTTETRQLVEARLAEHRAAAPRASSAAELESTATRLATETLPELVRVEIETERGQVLALVDQYLREFSAQGAQTTDRSEDRVAALDGVIIAKTREVAKREATEAAAGAVAGAQRIANDVTRQLRSSLALVYLAILGAALIGILAAAASFFVPH